MDISWIIEQERLEKIQKKCEREPFSTIELVSIYINLEMEIETIEKETMDVKEIKVLSKEVLKEWSIQKQKYTPNSIFEKKEMLWFHVDIEEDQIQLINEENISFLHNLSLEETEIKLTPSIFIFHSLTTLIFVYYEKTKPFEIIKKKEPKKKGTLRIIVPSKHKNKLRITRKIEN